MNIENLEIPVFIHECTGLSSNSCSFCKTQNDYEKYLARQIEIRNKFSLEKKYITIGKKNYNEKKEKL